MDQQQFWLVVSLALASRPPKEQRKGFAGISNPSRWWLSMVYYSEQPFQVLRAAFKPLRGSSSTWQCIDTCSRISSSRLAGKGDWWFRFPAALGALWGRLFSHTCVQLPQVYQFLLSIRMILPLQNKGFQGGVWFTKAVAKGLQGTWQTYRQKTYY